MLAVTRDQPLTFTITSNKTITATFSGAVTPLVLAAITVPGNGHVQFNVTGPAAASLIIEAVGALGESWIRLHTNSPFTGAFTFDDPTPGATGRYYRARLP